jgi:DNA polymerase III gamma/tau subunit
MSSSIFKNPMYIHIICETVIVGTLYLLMTKRVSKIQSELNECVVRLGKQTARIAELEETVQSMADSISMLHSMSLRSFAPPPMPPTASMASKAPSKPKEAPKAPAPAAPVAAKKAPVEEVDSEQDSAESEPQPFRAGGVNGDTLPSESSLPSTSLDDQIQSELEELEQPAQSS